MSPHPPADRRSLPVDALERIDADCQRFEAAWKEGRQPKIEAFLRSCTEPERSELMRELLGIDLVYRRRHGQTPAPDEYLRRFPTQSELIVSVFAEVDTLPSVEAASAVDGAAPRSLPWWVAAAAAGSTTPSRSTVHLPAVPGYEIHSELGRGGMGVVYKARQTKLNRLVALKMILAGGQASAQELARFHVEAQAVARLQHPGIVQVFDVGEHEGRPFFSLEFVEGGSLAGKMAGEPWPAARAAEVVASLAEAMQHAHGHGIIHRDLKPANVLLTADGQPKITDFGLAKQLDTDQHLSRSNAVMGTPSYMAPEQAAGAIRRIGPPTDVYALGAILYEFLTGRQPFRGQTPMMTLGLVLNLDPVAPTKLNPDVPRDLETICLKCLQKEPRKRYPSAQELADDLKRYLANEPIRARPVGRVEKTIKWAKRRPMVAFLLGSTVTVTLVGLVLVTTFWLRAEEARKREREEEAAKTRARQEAAAAEAEKWRKTLSGYHAEADSCLAEVRLLRQAFGREDVRDRVLKQIARFGELRDQAAAALKSLGEPSEALTLDEQRRWEERAVVLRNEAARWLTGIGLERGRVVTLPEGDGPTAGEMPTVALRPDMQQIAVVYPGASTIQVLKADGQLSYQLSVPDEIADKARRTRTETQKKFYSTSVTKFVTYPGFKLVYAANDVLTYQVGADSLSWKLPDRQPKRDYIPEGFSSGTSDLVSSTEGSITNLTQSLDIPTYIASSERYVAQRDPFRTAVTIREWTPGARPLVAWQPREKVKSGEPEKLREFAFDTQGRALFLVSNLRLCLIEAASGLTAEVPLSENTEVVRYGGLVPCPGSAAMVERRTVEGRAQPPQLVFWNALLPLSKPEALYLEDAPLGLDGAADGLVVTGGADHMVHAWRGRERLWASGIPYLAPERPVASSHERLPVGMPLADMHRSDHAEFSSAASESNWWRRVYLPREPYLESLVTYSPPDPYPWWSFSTDGRQCLLVERRELLDNGRSRLVTEYYSPDNGKVVDAFPVEGKGRLLHQSTFSPDRRYAVVVAEEKESRATLDVVSVADRKVLGRLGRYITIPENPAIQRVPTLRITYESIGGKDWLLLSKPVGPHAGVTLEIWRLPEVTLVGTMTTPTFQQGTHPVGDGSRVLLTGGNLIFPPSFARVIDLDTATTVCELQGWEEVRRAVNSTFTGTLFISPWHDALRIDPHRVTVWDLATGRRTDLGRQLWINGRAPETAVNPAGDRLLICGNLHDSGMARVELWDLNRMQIIKEATYPTKGTPWSSDAGELAFTVNIPDYPDKDKTRQLLWRWSVGSEIAGPPQGNAQMIQAKVTPLREWKWVLWWDGHDLLLQKGTGGKRIALRDQPAKATRVQWPKGNGHVLGLGGKGGGFWDANTGRRLANIPDDNHTIGCDPTERWGMTIANDDELVVWDLQSGKATYRCRPRQATEAAFDPAKTEFNLHPNGKRLVVNSQGVLRLWDIETNRQIAAIPRPGHFTPVRCVAQHAGAGLVASGGDDGAVFLWSRADGRAVRSFPNQSGPVADLAFRPDGAALAVAFSASGEGTVALHDMQGKTIWTFRTPGAETRFAGMAFRPSGNSLAVATKGGRLFVLDAGTGKQLDDWEVDTSGIDALAFAPDGSLLALGGHGGRVHLWDVASRKTVRSWDTFSPVTALAFVGGKDILATGGQNVRFWEAAGEPRDLLTLEVPRGPVRALHMNEKTGDLVLADQGEHVLRLSLADLLARIDRLKLGSAGLSNKWPGPNAETEKPQQRAPSSWQDWGARADEYLRDNVVHYAAWANSQAIRLNPAEWTLWYRSGRILAHAGWKGSRSEEYERSVSTSAVGAFTKALALKADDWHIWFERGRVHAELRQWQKAVDDCTKAIDQGATLADVWLARAWAQAELHRYDRAVADFDEVLRRDPNHVTAAVDRCDALRWLGEYDRAIADLDAVLKRDPQNAAALAVRSAAYRGKGMFDQAKTDVDAALRSDPDLAFARAQRGELHRVQNELDLARADYDEAIALDAKYVNAYTARGIVYQLKGDFGRAATDFGDALRLDPDNARLYLLRGDANRFRGEWRAAINDFDEALRLDPKLDGVYISRAWAFAGGRQYDKALADFDEAIRRNPKVPGSYNSRGLILTETRQYDKALADFDAAIRLDPTFILPYFNRGDLERQRRAYDKAVAAFTEAIKVKPDHGPSWQYRGVSHAELGNWDKAAADFARLAELLPKSDGALWHVLALLGNGNKDVYRTEYARLFERFRGTTNAGTASFVVWLGVLAPGVVDDLRPQVQLMEKVVAANPGMHTYLYTLGAAHYRAGRFAEAERVLTAANGPEGKGGSPYSWLFLAMNHARQKHTDEARKWLDRAAQRLDMIGRDPAKPDVYDNWQARLEFRLLRAEAESVVKARTPPESK